MILRKLLVCLLLTCSFINSAYSEEVLVDVLIEGYDDGVKSTLRNDREEALIDAKRQAIERAGVRMTSTTQMQDFVVKKDWVESKAKAVLLPGFQIIDKGYQADGSYLVILAGRIRSLVADEPSASDDKPTNAEGEDSSSVYNKASWEILAGDWDFDKNSITSKFVSDDSYLILKKELKDYIMEMTVTKIRGGVSYITVGIRQNIFEGGHEMLFRNRTSSRQGFQFGFLLDGRYCLFNGLNGLYYTIGNVNGLFQKNWDTTPLIDAVTNRLKIEAVGDNVKIFLNGKHFVEFKDSSHQYGSPMLIVTKNNQIRFSDLIIKPYTR
ncbi:MAG: family 16 glycoside hydrolase [Thermodesulfobacteriota bacterium]